MQPAQFFMCFLSTAMLLAAAPAHAQSSLADMLHGHQAPPKAPPPKVLATVSTAAGVNVDVQAETFLRTFAAALKARDAAQVSSLLAADYRIDGLPPRASARDTFRQAVERMKGPLEIVIRAVDNAKPVRTVRADFRFGEDDVKPRTLKFDAAGKLVWSDIFQVKVQGANE
jgi:hypothetical protein